MTNTNSLLRFWEGKNKKVSSVGRTFFALVRILYLGRYTSMVLAMNSRVQKMIPSDWQRLSRHESYEHPVVKGSTKAM